MKTTDNSLTQTQSTTKTTNSRTTATRSSGNLITQMRQQVALLYSPQVQVAFEKEKNQATQAAFIKNRQYFDNYLHTLERQSLTTILAKTQASKAELETAINSLNQALQNVNNTVNIVSAIEKVTRIMTRIIPLV
ncbi:MAG: hypothetical protein AAF757_21915 [Cyanobacteria bacterium P01_D01_bin.116]